MCVALVRLFRLVALRPWRVTFAALAHALADLRLMTKNCELLTDAENALADPPAVTSHFQAHLPRGRTTAVVRSTTVVMATGAPGALPPETVVDAVIGLTSTGSYDVGRRYVTRSYGPERGMSGQRSMRVCVCVCMCVCVRARVCVCAVDAVSYPKYQQRIRPCRLLFPRCDHASKTHLLR
jgi:hypothetical protein